jgi:hypothetical protein
MGGSGMLGTGSKTQPKDTASIPHEACFIAELTAMNAIFMRQ